MEFVDPVSIFYLKLFITFRLNEFYFENILQVSITFQVINGLYTGVTTQELDTLAAETAASMTTEHADYAVLAARISVSNLHKETKKLFSGENRQSPKPPRFVS